ncbi:MAG: type II secretion system F family protein [Candidatus Pacearchaeota archaeon]|jgi:archaellum biogenesis protein FlaJ (TadC family)
MKRKYLTKQEIASRKRTFFVALIISIIVSSLILLTNNNFLFSIIGFFASFFGIIFYSYFSKMLKESDRIKKMESVFPDFLQMMSSNLRAGMTIDRAILLSSRPEFAPLDVEILKTGKFLATSKNIEEAMLEMGNRIGSEKIRKTMLLIVSGIKSGGDLAILLEETAINMREREFLEKRAYSNVLMYVIFIFLVVSVFAPILFSLSNFLVEILSKILAGIPKVESSMNMPFTLSTLSVSITFIRTFSIVFILLIDVLASMVIGLVSKGEEKEGLKFLPAIVIISMSSFFITKFLISKIMSGFF